MDEASFCGGDRLSARGVGKVDEGKVDEARAARSTRRGRRGREGGITVESRRGRGGIEKSGGKAAMKGIVVRCECVVVVVASEPPRRSPEPDSSQPPRERRTRTRLPACLTRRSQTRRRRPGARSRRRSRRRALVAWRELGRRVARLCEHLETESTVRARVLVVVA